MSSVYATEPATSGRVIFDTTHGPLEIHLWCRECPQTTRLFLQLCLDGFYDEMVFHRIMPNFLIQTGALRQATPASSQNKDKLTELMKKYRQDVQADRALERRKYELNSRLRFNHRGQVAMAMTISDDDNNNSQEEDAPDLQPQFFITLDEASHLDGKHVLFGTILAPTVFNALRIGRHEVDESSHQPVDLADAPRIRSVKIVDNPIHSNLVSQPRVPWRIVDEIKPVDDKKRKKANRIGKYDINVLSFADEVNDDVGVRITQPSKKRKDRSTKQVPLEATTPIANDAGQERQPENPLDTRKAADEDEVEPTRKDTHSVEESWRPKDHLTSNALEKDLDHSSNDQQGHLNTVERRREKYLKAKKSKREREEETVAKLFAFQSKIRRENVDANEKTIGEDNSLAARMARRARAEDQFRNEAAADDGLSFANSTKPGSDLQRLKPRQGVALHHPAADQHEVAGDGRTINDYIVIDDRYVQKSYAKQRTARSTR